jgi:hypothetical protein
LVEAGAVLALVVVVSLYVPVVVAGVVAVVSTEDFVE